MAMMPSAIERQRRKATRKSCTGSGAKSTLARSHSSSTRSIQKAKPILFTDFAFSDFWVVGFAGDGTEAEGERDFAGEDMLMSYSRRPGELIPVLLVQVGRGEPYFERWGDRKLH